jgi:ATPase family AAA domain-containing protein 3A/B
LRKQEESVAKQEGMKRKTAEQEAEIRHAYEMKRLEAELKGICRASILNRSFRTVKQVQTTKF